MLTWIIMEMVALLVIVAVVVIVMRARKKKSEAEWDGKGAPSFKQLERMGKRMPSGEAMYAMSFPDLAPLFQPDQLLEWQAWYLERKKNRQIIRDGRRWHGQVPGFPDAATMSVKGEKADENSAELIVLQDQAGATLVEMVAESRADGSTTLTTDAGSFLIKPTADSKVRFTGTGRSFEWKGKGNWRFQTPVGAAPMQVQGGALQTEGSSGVGGAVAGLAAGAAVGVLAQQVWQAREAKEQAREKARQERTSSLDTDY